MTTTAIARKLIVIREKSTLNSSDIATVTGAQPETVSKWNQSKAAPRPDAPPSGASAPPAGEQGGLAVLRERHLEFNEPSFFRALSEADAEAVRAYLDGGMSAGHVFVDSNRRSPLMVLFFSAAACANP